MLTRPVGTNGDMIPIAYSNQMIEGGEAVAQIVKQRLLLYFGEWWENENIGFRIPQFLIEGVRQENLQMLSKYISSYVSDTEGVDSVVDSAVSLDGRKMTYSCVVRTGMEMERVDVTLDGILSAQY